MLYSDTDGSSALAEDSPEMNQLTNCESDKYGPPEYTTTSSNPSAGIDVVGCDIEGRHSVGIRQSQLRRSGLTPQTYRYLDRSQEPEIRILQSRIRSLVRVRA